MKCGWWRSRKPQACQGRWPVLKGLWGWEWTGRGKWACVVESSKRHAESSSTRHLLGLVLQRVTRQQEMKGNNEEGGSDSQEEYPRGHPLPASVWSRLYHSPGSLTDCLSLGKGGGDSHRVINLLSLLFLESACCTCYSLSRSWRPRAGGNGVEREQSYRRKSTQMHGR